MTVMQPQPTGLPLTEGQTVIMGCRCYDNFGPDLTSAHTLFVSRSPPELPGATVHPSLEAALETAQGLGTAMLGAGGATLCAQRLPRADAMYLSFIKGRSRGDAYFPPFDEADRRVEGRHDHPDFQFVIYRRTPTAPPAGT